MAQLLKEEYWTEPI